MHQSNIDRWNTLQLSNEGMITSPIMNSSHYALWKMQRGANTLAVHSDLDKCFPLFNPTTRYGG